MTHSIDLDRGDVPALLLAFCRYLALVYAIRLAIAETALNSMQPHWQYAPLWIIDYLMAAYLTMGFWASRHGERIPILMSAFALSTGVMYLAFFLNFDPELPDVARGEDMLVALIGLALGVSFVGLAGTTVAWFLHLRAKTPES